MPGAPLERPYDGAKEMILVDNVDNRAFLASLLAAMDPELPAPRKPRSGGRIQPGASEAPPPVKNPE